MTQEVKDVINEISAKGNTPNRFSKKNFNKLVKAILNDTSFVAKVAVSKDKKLEEVKDIAATAEFRKFLKKVLEKAGIDKNESEMVLDSAFTIDNVDGLYEFIATVLYEFMDAGNKFDFLPKEDFRGSIYLKNVEANETEPREARNPANGEVIGKFKYKNEAYKQLACSSPCPDWLKSRIEVK